MICTRPPLGRLQKLSRRDRLDLRGVLAYQFAQRRDSDLALSPNQP